MTPPSTHPIKRACYSFIDLGRMKKLHNVLQAPTQWVARCSITHWENVGAIFTHRNSPPAFCNFLLRNSWVDAIIPQTARKLLSPKTLLATCIWDIWGPQNTTLLTFDGERTVSLHWIKQALRPNKASFPFNKSTRSTTGGMVVLLPGYARGNNWEREKDDGNWRGNIKEKEGRKGR